MHAYIIAGGKSKRMGFDKRTLTIDGKTLLERTINILTTVFGEKPVLVGDNLSEVNKSSLRVINDYKPGCGPMGGILAALEDNEKEWTYVLASDLPSIQASDIQNLIDYEDSESDIVSVGVNNRFEPLIAKYRKKNIPFWKKQLHDGEYSIQKSLNQIKHRVIDPVSSQDAVCNLNRPSDFERFKQKQL